MQKNDIPCIKTGDFAKLCGTNKRTLIHYDEIGIFLRSSHFLKNLEKHVQKAEAIIYGR